MVVLLIVVHEGGERIVEICSDGSGLALLLPTDRRVEAERSVDVHLFIVVFKRR